MAIRRTSAARALAAAALASAGLAGCATSGGAPVDCRCKGPADPIALEREFLAKNAQAKNVVVLPGLQYMVLQSGPANGPHPKRSDDITVRYEGRFLNGQVFNSSPRGGQDTTTFELDKLIPGWGAALQMMRPGDVWMLYVPYNLGYGEAGKSYIPPYSTLVFRVELVAVAPHQEPPPPPPPPPPPSPPPPVPAPVPLPPPPAPAKKVVHHHHRPRPKPAADAPAGDGGTPTTSDDKTPGRLFPNAGERD